MKLIKYLATWHETNSAGISAPKFLAGSYHAVTEETLWHAAQGVAEEVDAPDDAEKAVEKADKAEVKAADAQAAADAAAAVAEAATAAAAIGQKPAE